jgi:hypothetical protein
MDHTSTSNNRQDKENHSAKGLSTAVTELIKLQVSLT